MRLSYNEDEQMIADELDAQFERWHRQFILDNGHEWNKYLSGFPDLMFRDDNGVVL